LGKQNNGKYDYILKKAVFALKKRTKILLGIVLTILVAVVVIGIWQRNNIAAVVKSVSKSQEEIAGELNSSKKQLENELSEKYTTIVSDFTAEEERQIMKGELSIEEVKNRLDRKYEEKKNSSSAVTSPQSAEVDKLIGDKVIELYSLKAYYLGQLGQIEASVKKDYIAMPEEKRNLVGKQELATKYMGTALSLMNQCDAQVNELLSGLEKSLKKLNGDTAIIKTIRDAYENEKALKKAYYLKLLEG
jgi:hypothetical protein